MAVKVASTHACDDEVNGENLKVNFKKHQLRISRQNIIVKTIKDLKWHKGKTSKYIPYFYELALWINTQHTIEKKDKEYFSDLLTIKTTPEILSLTLRHKNRFVSVFGFSILPSFPC